MTQKKISQKEFNKALKLTIVGGCSYTIWYAVSSPQPIFNVFFTNYLGASSSQLGLLIAIVQLSTLFNLVGIVVYGKLKSRKKYFVTMSLIHRLLGVLLAFASFYVAKTGNSSTMINIIFIASGISWMLAHSSGAGWWSWMADLIPDNIRASFFGQRSSLMNIVNIIWFMGVSLSLDLLTDVNVFIIYGVIFSIASIGGLLDIILCIPIIEPEEEGKESISLKNFKEPLHNKNFIVLAIGVGVSVFAINVFSPFTAPYITAKETINAPNTWLGIMFVISQLTWILVSPSWGLIMDKFGRKPVLMIGCLSSVANLLYLVLNSANYTFILPVIALTSGLLTPALWDGINQMMLSLTPNKNRTAFVAWNTAIVGIISAGGALVGGVIKDYTEGMKIVVFNNYSLSNIHIILILSIALMILGLLIISTVKENKSKPLRYVVSRVVRPGVFRTFSNMGKLSGTTNSARIERTLRSIDGDSNDIALDDVISRMYDPDSDVREEAARALGRIKSSDAVEPLIQELNDDSSTIRTQAAISLGKIGDERALPHLFNAIESESEDLQNAAVKSLGMINSDESIDNLLKLFTHKSEKLAANGAVAISQLGVLEAAWDIIPKMQTSQNPVLARQLAISVGNLLGKPGEFYKYITGKESSRTSHIKMLFTDVTKKCTKMISYCGKNKLTVEEKKKISLRIKKVESLMDEGRLEESFGLLKLTVKIVIRSILSHQHGLEESKIMEELFLIDQKIAIWWWFITQAEENIESASTELKSINILLVLYFIHTFRVIKPATV